MAPLETQALQADIALYRILGARDDYLGSRPVGEGDHELVLEDSPLDGDKTCVVIGGRPVEYIAAWRRAWALIVASLKYSSMWKNAEDVVQARDDFCEQLAADVDLPAQLLEDCGLWVTVKVWRRCEVTPASDGRYFWARYTEIKAISDAFLVDVVDHVDLIMAGVEAETGIALTVPVVTDNRALVFVEGRAPFALPLMRALGGSVAVSQQWADIQPQTIRQRLEQILERPDRVRDRVAAAYRWLVMSERDDDPLRSFLFGFVGLEGLAQGLTRHLLPTAKARLHSDPDHALPIDDLIWPQPEDDSQYPDRNALFSFAILASALGPRSAADDLAQFKTFQKDRHRIAHGKDHALETFPVSECQSLLRRYINLVSNHEWDQA